MRKILTTLAALAVVAAVGTAPASAITDGEPDGDGHPFVGLMVAQDESGNPLWRCSGTMISPTVYLTAGHCTEAPAATAQIWFDADVDAGIPGNGYPYTGQAGGTAYVHPDFYTAPFFVHDVGVVLLDEPVDMPEYGTLPDVNQLDKLKTKRGKQDVTFTAVGYGLQKSFPDAASWKTQADRVRYVAHPKLNQINVPGFTGDFSMLLSNNARTGGTCFGDSGGPNFLGDSNVVAGVTSFGINGNCAGTGGVFRMDRASALDFVMPFLD
jgi:V8-like Glu-specific endopeptidase